MRLNVWTTALFLTVAVFFVGCSESATQKTEDVPEEEPEVEVADYKVAMTEPMPIGNTKRFTWHVVVDKPVTPEDLEVVAEDVVMEAREAEAFNALTIMFYDWDGYVGHGFTLGKSTFAPQGDWGQAHSVSTGDYDAMTLTHELRKKDWSMRLTEEEAVVWKAWRDKYNREAEVDPARLPDEEEIIRQIAADKSKSPDDVSAIIIKQETWTLLDE